MFLSVVPVGDWQINYSDFLGAVFTEETQLWMHRVQQNVFLVDEVV